MSLVFVTYYSVKEIALISPRHTTKQERSEFHVIITCSKAKYNIYYEIHLHGMQLRFFFVATIKMDHSIFIHQDFSLKGIGTDNQTPIKFTT